MSLIIWECISFQINFQRNKFQGMKRTYEIGSNAFPIVEVLFPHPVTILWYIS